MGMAYKTSKSVSSADYFGQPTDFCLLPKIELVFYSFLCYNIFTAIVLQGGWPPLHRMEVMQIKDHFDFKDLMSFAMFLLALLTFIYLICH